MASHACRRSTLSSSPLARRWLVVVASAVLLAVAPGARAAAPEARLAADGKALLPIVIPADASPRVRAAAESLAGYLGRIASARFDVTTGDGTRGIALGLAGGFRALNLARELNADGPARLEQYLLRTHPGGVYAVAATELGVEHAAWDLLYRLGYRQFFPGDAWEVVPQASTLAITVDAIERPAYHTRRIWFGHGTWDFNDPAHAAWRARNRAAGAFELNTGHAYDGILRQYKAEFDRHPEYRGLVDGQRTSSKLCASNPGVRALIVRYARDFFARRPDADSVSIDPSDGGGWCQCDGCKRLGSPTDAALTLANEISAVLEAEYPGKYVGLYAYNQHSPPPSIQARPRVIVSAATAFLKGHTVEQVIDGWNAKGVRQFGIREYYGVHTWDRDLPGRSRGSNLDYLRRTIPAFHARGARFMSAESSDSWAPNGLGFYLASRMLWDVREAERVDALRADFLDKAFGPAREPMAGFYGLLDGSHPSLMSSDLVGRMYRLLDEAGRLARDAPGVRARLDQLVLYARYVELFREYDEASGKARQAAFERLMRHAYRMSGTMMVHSKGLFRDLPGRDKSVTVPAGANLKARSGANVWNDSETWSRDELDALVAAGVERNRLAGFTPVEFGDDLIPAAGPLELPDLPPLEDTQRTRGEHTVYTWVDDPSKAFEFQVTGGLIAHYRDRGDARLRLFAGPLGRGTERGGDEETPVAEGATAPDGIARTVTLKPAAPGLHRVWLSDGKDATEVRWPAGAHRTVRADAQSRGLLQGRRSGYFYVPRGTKVVGGYAHGAGAVHDAEGKLALKVTAGDYFKVDVPPGQDGRAWSLRGVAGNVGLMTVPPFLARAPRELLLPKAVVEADAVPHR